MSPETILYLAVIMVFAGIFAQAVGGLWLLYFGTTAIYGAWRDRKTPGWKGAILWGLTFGVGGTVIGLAATADFVLSLFF